MAFQRCKFPSQIQPKAPRPPGNQNNLTVAKAAAVPIANDARLAHRVMTIKRLALVKQAADHHPAHHYAA